MADGDKGRLGPRVLRPADAKAPGSRNSSWQDAGQDAASSGGKPLKGQAARWRELTPADHLPALTDGFSLVTEQFRLMRAKLDSMETPLGGPPRVLAVTSAVPGEGKSCTSLNTALVTAQEVGRRVCFVECDLRRQHVHELLQDPPVLGLSDLLQARAPLKDVLLHMDRPEGLSMIPAGSSPPNPVELLGSKIMQRLVAHLRDAFDVVILDTPPALNFADAVTLGPVVDGFILVVRAGKAPRDAILQVHRSLSRFHVAGVILNDAEQAAKSAYGYYYRKYGGYGPVDGKGGSR